MVHRIRCFWILYCECYLHNLVLYNMVWQCTLAMVSVLDILYHAAWGWGGGGGIEINGTWWIISAIYREPITLTNILLAATTPLGTFPSSIPTYRYCVYCKLSKWMEMGWPLCHRATIVVPSSNPASFNVTLTGYGCEMWSCSILTTLNVPASSRW